MNTKIRQPRPPRERGYSRDELQAEKNAYSHAFTPEQLEEILTLSMRYIDAWDEMYDILGESVLAAGLDPDECFAEASDEAMEFDPPLEREAQLFEWLMQFKRDELARAAADRLQEALDAFVEASGTEPGDYRLVVENGTARLMQPD